MVIEDELVQGVILLDQEGKLALLIVGPQVDGSADVALAVRRPLDELPELVAVALRPANVTATLHHQELDGAAAVVECPPMQDVPVQDDVVARPNRKVAETRLEHALAFGDINHFIRLRIAVEVIIEPVGFRPQHGNVGVEQQRRAIERRAAAPGRRRGPEVTMAQRRRLICFPDDIADLASRRDRRRRVDVIEQRRRPVNPS